MMDIVGLGTLAMDVLIRVDKLPGADSFCIVKSQETKPGGSGTNVIVQSARLGARTAFIGAVGDDDIGRKVIESLKSEKVDTSGMVMKKNMITLHTEIVIDDAGSKFIMLNMGDAFASLRSEEVSRSLIDQSKVFYTDLFPYGEASRALVEAKKKGVKTVFNMQVGMETFKGMGIGKEDILRALPDVDVFAPCHEGLVQLTGTEDLDECVRFLRTYCRGILVFTLGENGSVAFDGENRRFSTDRYTAGKVIDTTGAGDSYIGAFMVAYFLRKYSLEKSIRFASVCAGYTCTGLGARSGPAADKADELFRNA